jgi:hypothetical protein
VVEMKRLALTALLVLIGFALAGCASSGGKHSTERSSHPQGSAYSLRVVPGNKDTLGRAIKQLPLFLSPTNLAIATRGSSNCPAVPKKLVVLTPNTIRIDLTEGSWRPTGTWLHHRVNGRRIPRMRLVARPPANGICLTDLTSTPIIVSIPSQINSHHRLTIRFYDPPSKKPFVTTVPPL